MSSEFESKDEIKNDFESNIINVSDERQTYLLSNYSTLRTNFKWDNAMISCIINKLSKIRILPPKIREEEMYISRRQYVLKMDKEHLENASQSVESSCKSIIDYVRQSKTDPLLSENNPFKQGTYRHSTHIYTQNRNNMQAN